MISMYLTLISRATLQDPNSLLSYLIEVSARNQKQVNNSGSAFPIINCAFGQANVCVLLRCHKKKGGTNARLH